jgi:GT2 family glycosyltransferase
LAGTDWPADRMEVIVVDNGSTQADCLEGLAQAQAQGRITVIRCDEPFNFSRLNNIAARSTEAELLVFLNNDTTARRPDWLRILAAHALQPDVGAVGPKLLYPDETVQHGGLVLGMEGGAVNAFVGLGMAQGGYAGLANLTREISAVVGACLCIRREVFLSVGGFNEALAVGFNDMVLCMDVLASQLRNVFVAEPLFFHLEYVSRGRDTTPEKVRRLAEEHAFTTRLHPDLFLRDPYYSANLSKRVLFMLPGSAKEPPRLSPGPASFRDRLPREIELVGT